MKEISVQHSLDYSSIPNFPVSTVKGHTGKLFFGILGGIKFYGLMGIFLAVPVALSSLWSAVAPDPFLLFLEPPWGAWPGVLAFSIVALFLVRAGLVRSVHLKR